MAKGFTRGQTQVIYRFLPGAVFEHDEYGVCRVTSVSFRETNVNTNALFDALTDALSQWQNDQFRADFPDPRDDRQRRHYVVGSPSEVRFEPYPRLLTCRNCSRVFQFRDLRQRRHLRPGYCPECGGALIQLRYIQAHNCGRLEELYFPQRGCPRHGVQQIRFYDPGRVRLARWVCGICSGEIQRLRMTPCSCAYSAVATTSDWERRMKVFAATDPALYMPHVTTFINFREEEERSLRTLPDAYALLLARTWGICTESVPGLLQARKQWYEHRVDNQQDEDPSEAIAEALANIDPDHPAVRRWREVQEQQAHPPGEEAITRVNLLLGNRAPGRDDPPPRQLVEHIALHDTLRLTDIATVAEWMRNRGDEPGAAQIEKAGDMAHNAMGIRRTVVANDFPISLCAVGYTRVSRNPSQSVFTPFASDERGRIPLYVIPAETEGIALQLDPVWAARWLVRNEFVQGPEPVDLETAWAWIFRHLPGLWQSRWQPDYASAPVVALRMLLHTMSHVFLRRIEWSGFSPASVGEHLMPGTLSSVLYANRYAESKIGGLTTLFEQRLGAWMWDALQSGRECVYDPLCSDEGGSCAGCLHREYNCPKFNSELSRATLYGGPTHQTGALDGTVFQHGYWEAVREATPVF